ncbi:hypothetical protein V6Z11_D09G026300 [Gossypium hirsutum]
MVWIVFILIVVASAMNVTHYSSNQEIGSGIGCYSKRDRDLLLSENEIFHKIKALFRSMQLVRQIRGASTKRH